MSKEKSKSELVHKILTVAGIVLCVILIPVLIINCTLIIKSYVDPDAVPSIGGWCPLIVLTDSMDPNIKSGDLIICKATPAEEVREKDVIAYFDQALGGDKITTHRVVEVIKAEDGTLAFRTQGDANNTPDSGSVAAKDLVGVYQTRIPGAGNVAMFMQTTPGLIVCVVLPVLLLVGYDFLRRKKYEKSKQDDTDALLAELEALKAEKARQEACSAEPAQAEAEAAPEEER